MASSSSAVPSTPSAAALPRMRLQPRDVAMLASLAEARYLTAWALEWLHFPSWRTRYHAAVTAGTVSRYQASSNLYHRLGLLQAHGLIIRLARIADSLTVRVRRSADAYALTPLGATILTEYGPLEPEQIWCDDHRSKALQNFEHRIAIGVCYAALRAEATYRHRTLTHWRGDHQLARQAYDRVPISGQRDPEPVLPDATCLFDGERLVLELDRGTRPLRSWYRKAQAYDAYQGHPLLQQRYGTAHFRVLVVAPSMTRLQRIAEEVVKVNRQTAADYLFLPETHVHPTTIRRGWFGIGTVVWTTNQVVDRLVEQPQVTLAPSHLWEPTPS
ncbi:replication-relaxation family protein [Candidatus Chloroploca asiatica]|nr:replication-relaxation family protein [Candidatus Chloroploca asiatica]